ncbi:MAG TPA: class I SAM-dependent methyltransferase, partial [Thermoplasmata archaeon]|nr:class I SAM-dependent methyltransferase [Thermoplasmata archaeon]
MTAEQQALFHRRAEDVFHVSLSDPPGTPQPGPIEDSPPEPRTLSMDLVIGFTATYPVAAGRLLGDIASIFDRGSPGSPLRRIVICDNSGDESLLAEVVQSAVRAGLPVRVVSKEEIDTAASQGRLSDYYVDSERRKGVAFGRTALHTFLLEEAAVFKSSVVWILDDDVRLDDIRVGETGRVESQEDLTRLLCGLRELGHSAVVGGTWGDPPLPAGVLLRTQLLDFSENLRTLTTPQGTPLPSAQNDPVTVRLFPEYYYDASLRHSGHLELPFGYPTDGQERTPAKALAAMLASMPEILQGRELFRVAAPAFSIPPPMGLPNRGGNTLVFDLQVLAGCPNVSPRIGGVDARRGDTLWCMLSNALAGSSPGRLKPPVGHFPWFVRHDRSTGRSRSLALLPVIADLYGRSFTRAVAKTIAPTAATSGGSGPGGGVLPPPAAGPVEALVQSKEELWETFLGLRNRANIQFQLNAWRIRGLVKTIRAQLEARASWTPEASIEVKRHAESIESFLQAVERTFAEVSVEVAVSDLDGGGRHDFFRFIEELPRIVSGYRESQLAVLEEAERRRDARLICTRFRAVAPAFLAAGNEGRVYFEGGLAYKVFREGPLALSSDQLNFLLKGLPREGEATRLVPILGSASVEGRLIIQVPFVDGERYAGGHLNEILQLVRECRQRGLVLTNLHPDNLLAGPGGVRYVDLGRSIQPFTESSFREMCKRGYLCYRWHFRADLRELLSRSLYDEALPELTGFHEFLDAVEPRNVHDLMDSGLLDTLGQCGVTSVLDFGCGKGALTAKLIAGGYEVAAYDPDPDCVVQVKRRLPCTRVLDREGLAKLRAAGERFDAVVCSLVLCTIDTSQGVEDVLLEARELLSPSGYLILAVCDPFSLDVRESTLSVKLGPEDGEYRRAFPIEKLVKLTGATRVDYHRPLAWYR